MAAGWESPSGPAGFHVEEPDDLRTWFRRYWWVGLLLVALAAVLIVAAISDEDSTRADPAGPACADFIIAVSDARDGILTDAEFRAAMQEVLRKAEGTRVEPLARRVLAEVTSGTSADLLDAIDRMIRPCSEAVGSD